MLQSNVFRKKLLASKNKRLLAVIALFSLQVVILPSLLMAQPNADNDSSYFLKYPGSITTRFYVSQKYTDFNIQGNDGAKDIKYLPNTTLNMGIGATYQNFSLNLAYGFGFINNDDDKGNTLICNHMLIRENGHLICLASFTKAITSVRMCYQQAIRDITTDLILRSTFWGFPHTGFLIIPGFRIMQHFFKTNGKKNRLARYYLALKCTTAI
jgi:hypothetical protein